jgi:hypothetical protein
VTQAATNTNYTRPFRPRLIRLFNKLPRLRSDKAVFNPDNIISYAQKMTGETELSDAPLREPLEKLCAAIAEEAQLSNFGRVVQETRLKNLLVNRFRLDAITRKHPAILDAPTPDVIVIAGLARTGTTLLHRTLAADPDARSLPSWEALNPAPFPKEKPNAPASRIKKGQSATAFMGWLAPDFSAVHPVSALEPEEDILLLDLTMVSQTAEAMMHVPSYSAWLETIDHRPAYEYLRDTLKVLDWLKPAKHWVLKTPNHSEQLGVIMNVFPNATIIQTHRHPSHTMASCCSLMAHTMALSSDHIDTNAIGRHWLRKAGRMAAKAHDARQAHPDRSVIDMHYTDLVADPLNAVATVYAARGVPLSGTRRAAISHALDQPRPHRDRRHAYHLSDFGLTDADLDHTFHSYCNDYNISAEGLTP